MTIFLFWVVLYASLCFALVLGGIEAYLRWDRRRARRARVLARLAPAPIARHRGRDQALDLSPAHRARLAGYDELLRDDDVERWAAGAEYCVPVPLEAQVRR